MGMERAFVHNMDYYHLWKVGKKLLRIKASAAQKVFDTLNYALLIAKLSAYSFTNKSLKLIESYVTNRWQRTKLNKSFSKLTELLQGVS